MQSNNTSAIAIDSWPGGLDAMLRSAERLAAARFANAIRRHGFAAEDIAMDGVVRVLQSCAHRGAEPTPALLCWAIDKAGLDKIRREGGPGGGPRPRRRDPEVPDPGPGLDLAVTVAFPDEIVDGHDLARPDELAQESVHWGQVAMRLQSRATGGGPRRGATDRRAVFADAAMVVAERLARRAAADPAWRTAYADAPRLAIWAIIREVEPGRFGAYSDDAFPSHGNEADRRRAFRLAHRVVAIVGEIHRSLYEMADDDTTGAA
jgi:hypothetical protein